MSRAEAKERRKQQVLAAVEASIRRDGRVNFSMRELADNAQVSFATPFNLFGKKEDILAALFNQRVTELALKCNTRNRDEDGLAHLLTIAADSCKGYLSDAELFKPLAQSFRTQITPQLEAVSRHAQAIWKDALDECLLEKTIEQGIDLDALARRIHISFRVVFWMWATEEISDQEFQEQVHNNTAACLLPHTTLKGRKALLAALGSA